MTDNEPTVRYWRDEDGVITRGPYPPLTRGTYVEMHLYSAAELAAHTTAARADAYDEGVRRTLRYAGMPADTWWRNPYIESED